MIKKILISVFALGFIAAVLSVYALEKKHDLIAEIKNKESDNYHLIMGYDLDKNGVRDDLDSLIDANLNEPEHRAAYRYFAKKSLEQWKAFYYNQQMTYEELYEYEIYSSLGISLIGKVGAKKFLKFDFFVIRLTNTKERLLFEHSIDLKFAGQLLPSAVLYDKRFSSQKETGLAEFQEILEKEREGL